MNSYKFVFITLLICLSATLINSQNLSSTWEVQKYDITATLPQNFADRDLDVKANLNLKNVSGQAFSRLTLRISDQAAVSSVRVNNAAADFKNEKESIGGKGGLQKILINIPTVQPKAAFSVAVNYKLKVKENSGLNALSPIGSQFLPMSFWYPTPNSWYFAGGADFAPINLQINSSNNQQIISAGMQNGNGFDSKLNGQPFFAAGQWQKINSNGVEVFAPIGTDLLINKRAEELASLASEAKTFVSGLLGNSANFPIKIVSVTRGAGFSDSGTIFVDDSVFSRKKIDAQTALNISEGIAKTWLGNIVKVNGNGYGVIREGLARYIATEFIEKKYGKQVAEIERLRQRANYSSVVNRDSPLNISSPVDGYYFTLNANKGAIIWKYLAKRYGKEDLFKIIQEQTKSGKLDLNELRSGFSTEKEYLDYTLDKITEMNILVGLPQKSGVGTKVALRNLGEIPVNVEVVATLENGQNLLNQTTIPAKSFGEVTFNTQTKIVRVEVDPDKIYPQINYADDTAPKEIDDDDAIVYIKRDFDRQKYAEAEIKAKTVLNIYQNFDDAKILLARSLLAQNKNAEAQKVFQSIFDEKLPTARSLAWASVGLGEIAQKAGQNAQAVEHFEQAIKSAAEYGATLAAINGRNKINPTSSINADVAAFFEKFDKIVTLNDKAQVEALIVNGEIARFASSVAGNAQQWNTKILHTDKVNENTFLVETNLNIKLLNRNNESGLAVFRLTKVGNDWKLSGVDIFEVR
ncbi:MAG: hypothetical protein ACR2MD_09880 [Aridibacter sp.]